MHGAGKLSGQAAVTSRLKGLGYSLTKEQMADIFIRFKVCLLTLPCSLSHDGSSTVFSVSLLATTLCCSLPMLDQTARFQVVIVCSVIHNVSANFFAI